jgi:hypothetical protein
MVEQKNNIMQELIIMLAFLNNNINKSERKQLTEHEIFVQQNFSRFT